MRSGCADLGIVIGASPFGHAIAERIGKDVARDVAVDAVGAAVIAAEGVAARTVGVVAGAVYPDREAVAGDIGDLEASVVNLGHAAYVADIDRAGRARVGVRRGEPMTSGRDHHRTVGQQAFLQLSIAGLETAVARCADGAPRRAIERFQPQGVGGGVGHAIGAIIQLLHTGHVPNPDEIAVLQSMPAGRDHAGRRPRHPSDRDSRPR
ncbi:hypothetical protein D3C85_1281430 [compost metagenome]